MCDTWSARCNQLVSELPSGTVSLLFSDIEGSTLHLNRLGPGYADALDAQRQVLRKAWAAHGGTELGTEGDSFFVVSPRPRRRLRQLLRLSLSWKIIRGRAASACECVSGSTPGPHRCITVIMWGWTCTGPPESPDPPTEAR
jgi:class 3 adenylate cyclase